MKKPQSQATMKEIKTGMMRDFRGGLLVKTLCSYCRMLKFELWLGE